MEYLKEELVCHCCHISNSSDNDPLHYLCTSHVQKFLLTSCHDTEISYPFMHGKSINVAIAKINVTMVT